MPHKLGRKPRFPELAPSNLTEKSRKTHFIFKKDSDRSRVFILAKISPISLHHHIKITTRGHCLIYRNFNKIIARQEIVYGIILKILRETLEKALPLFKEDIKGPKRVRGTETL
jgi:hypothetical protein